MGCLKYKQSISGLIGVDSGKGRGVEKVLGPMSGDRMVSHAEIFEKIP
jgi:hypothetical protein